MSRNSMNTCHRKFSCICLLFAFSALAALPSGELLANSEQSLTDDSKGLLERVTVLEPDGTHVNKANIFIGDVDENAPFA